MDHVEAHQVDPEDLIPCQCHCLPQCHYHMEQDLSHQDPMEDHWSTQSRLCK